MGWPSSWSGNGEYLHVQRVNFEPLFRRATFSNTQYPDKTPYYQIGDTTVTRMSTAATFDSWYLVNTFIRVYADNAGSATAGALQLSHTLQGGVNFVYASDRWQIP